MTTWSMNGEVIAVRNYTDLMFSNLVEAIRGDRLLRIEQDEPDYLAFYDEYGNKHEYSKEN